MDFIPKDISHYCQLFSTDEEELLKVVNRETHLKVLSPRMLSGHLQGLLLSFLSQMIEPSRILEIGTYTGYSALALAKGLVSGGILYTIEVNEENLHFARKHINESSFKDQIRLVHGDAKTIIPELKEEFDLVFIDADKKNYSLYLDLVLSKLSPKGIILADNVLWSGKVLLKEEEMDKETQAIHEFNKRVKNDKSLEVIILPFRDGLSIIKKAS